MCTETLITTENIEGPSNKFSKLDSYERQEIISYGHNLTNEVELINYHTLQVKNLPDIAKILPMLSDYPIDQFLRRIYSAKKRILIAPIVVDITELKLKLIEQFDENIEFHQQPIPKTKPLLRIQHEKVKDLWPVKFTVRNDYEEVYHKKILNKEEVNIYFDIFKKIDGDFKCIIFDDKLKKILTEAEFDPNVACGHASMMVADKIAACCSESSDRYYGFGCTAILSQEPCVMCAMALNHLRIKRIFFLRKNPLKGAFTRNKNILSTWDSHHRYDVYYVLKY